MKNLTKTIGKIKSTGVLPITENMPINPPDAFMEAQKKALKRIITGK